MNRRELLCKKLVTMALTGVLLLLLLSLSPSASLPQATEEDVALGAAGVVEELLASQNDASEYPAAAPGEATLISPTGSIDTKNPTYTWNEVEDSLWYLLVVENSSGIVIEQWYKADDVTSGSTCSATPSESLFSGKP